ncbi:hypothetical protein SLEP1_g57191 [Rubroshorea leprosula]|uniref:Ribosomal protein L32 n=1 Tax=Rubroshorea leprosula TaxID=152421 RepID=A0AAV5MM33_9ROSI|nr:hypothetical protein SLEP1_g57191 [Rubroshorea leprosula]
MADEKTPKQKLKLCSYWRSSCSWRVRIALNLKASPLPSFPCSHIGMLSVIPFPPFVRKERSGKKKKWGAKKSMNKTRRKKIKPFDGTVDLLRKRVWEKRVEEEKR